MSNEAEITRLSRELSARREEFQQMAMTNIYGLSEAERMDLSAKHAIADAKMRRAYVELERAVDAFAAKPTTGE